MNLDTFLPILASFISGMIILVKMYSNAKNVASVFQNAVFVRKSTVTKIAFQAKVAEVALLLAEFVKLDLIDGEPQMLNLLKEFLCQQMKASKAQHPINNLHP